MQEVWLHGSTKRFDRFESRFAHTFGAVASQTPIFLTRELSTAIAFASPSGYIYRVRLDPSVRIFESDALFSAGWPQWWIEDSDLSALGLQLLRDLEAGRIYSEATEEDASEYLKAIALSYYDTMESSQMKEWLLLRGFDAFRVREIPGAELSLAVMKPELLTILSVDPYPQ